MILLRKMHTTDPSLRHIEIPHVPPITITIRMNRFIRKFNLLKGVDAGLVAQVGTVHAAVAAVDQVRGGARGGGGSVGRGSPLEGRERVCIVVCRGG